MSNEFPDEELSEDTLDFDQFWANKPIKEQEKVKILGEWVVVPTDVPLALEQKAQQTQVGNADATKELLGALYGEDAYDEWVGRGLTIRQLTIIMAWSMIRIQGKKLSFTEVADRMDEVMASGKVQALFGSIGAQSNPDSTPPRLDRKDIVEMGSRQFYVLLKGLPADSLFWQLCKKTPQEGNAEWITSRARS